MSTIPLQIDAELIERARDLAGTASAAEVIETALREWIRRQEQAEILEWFGTVEFDPSYDHRRERRAR